MERPCHELLPRTAFPFDQDRRPAGGRLTDEIEDLLHAPAAADDVLEIVATGLEIVSQRPVFSDQPSSLGRVTEHDHHLVVLERLFDVVEGPPLHRHLHVLHRAERRDHDDGQVFINLLQLLQRLHAVHPRHHEVEDHRVERPRPCELESFVSRHRQRDTVPLAHEQRIEDLAHDLFVVDDQNRTGVEHKNAWLVGDRGRALPERGRQR